VLRVGNKVELEELGDRQGQLAPPKQRPSLRHRHSISINISARLDASTISAAVVVIIIRH
jgi:hypothetical protein